MSDISIGLDINTAAINIIQLDRKGEQYILKAHATTQNTPKGMFSESLFDQEEMADRLRTALSDAKINEKHVNIALPDNQVFTKVLDMPTLTDKELSTAVFWEAEQYIPAQLSQMTLDWHVLHRDDAQQASGRMQVLLVAAPNALIKKYQHIMELASLNVTAIETEILSVVRSVVVDDQFPTSMIAHIGNLNTSFAIVQNGIVVFTYTFHMGSTAINRAIAADFGFTIEQAEEYRSVYGLTDASLGGKIGKAIDPVLTSFMAEVKKALIYFNERYKNQSQLSQVLLTGSGSKLPGLEVYFVKHIGIETGFANPFILQNIQNVPSEIMDTGSSYAIALGLALRDYENE